MNDEPTLEEKELLHKIADKWGQAALKQPVINKEIARELINYYYQTAEMSPPIIIFTGSPAGNQVAANWIGYTEEERLEKATKVYGDGAKEICAQIQWESKYEKEYAGQRGDSEEYHEPYSILSNSGWLSFFDFFRETKVIDCPKFSKIADLAIVSGVWEALFFEGFCFVCGCPSEVRVEEFPSNNEETSIMLHSDQAPAIAWPDGHKFYCLRNVEFEPSIWKKIISQEFRIEDLQSLTNADQNAIAVGMLSPERLLEFTGAKFLNKGVKGTELYKVENFMGRGETEYAMVMTCQSTGRKFLEWAVDKEVAAKGDADEAHACSFIDADGNRLSVEDYLTMAES